MIATMTAEPHSARKNCDCGCEPQECCELECLVQPRFFCGQLLADQDLTAMVDWVKAKTGLARYRHGWGVVCGLDVHCGKRGVVTVSPGYALDCCGRDIVVCEEASYDLTKCWKRPSDPCGDGDLHALRRDGQNAVAEPKLSFGELEIERKEVQAFDLYIRYSESASDARTALARGGCGGTAGCEYTRVKEGYRFECRPADDCFAPPEHAAIEWDDRYREELGRLIAILERIIALENTREIPTRLLAFLQEHPLHTFCFIREWLCAIQKDAGGVEPRVWREVAFWILQDWRNAYFAATCKGCGPDTGILLARVWVWGRPVDNRERYSTLYVETRPPFRRPIARDEFPAPAGTINAAPYIWQLDSDVKSALRGLGFMEVRSERLDFDDLRQIIGRPQSLFLHPEMPVTAYYYVDRCERRRIVGFDTPEGLPVPPAPPPPTPSARPSPNRTRAGRR